MSGVASSNPVERDQAELEVLMAEFNEMVGQGGEPAGTAETEQDLSSNQPEPEDHFDEQKQVPSDDSFEQKWKSLQGIVKAKDTQIEGLSLQVNQLLEQNQQIMAQLQSAPAQAESQEVSTEATSGNLLVIADSIRDQFGNELGDVFSKFAAHIQKIEDNGQKLGKTLGEVTSKMSVSAQSEAMTRLCPTWQAVDKDQGFISWLQNPAPYSNKKLLDVLNDNWASGNVEMTARIFNEYISNTSAPTRTAADPRAGLVTPGSSGGSKVSHQPQESGQIYSEAQVNKMMRDLQTGVYRNDPAKAAKVEQEISLAYLENRVR